MSKIVNSLRIIKDSVVDARKRRLISKRVVSHYGRRRYKFSLWRYGFFLGLIIALLASGYFVDGKKKESAADSTVANAFSGGSKTTNANILNDDTSINLALDLAEKSNLSVAQDVQILAEMNSIKKEVASQTTELTVAKAAPIFDLASSKRGITYHVVKEGETLQQIADANKISVNTVKWANNLKDDSVKPGTKLKILPLDGVLYKVKKNDTLSSIADKYKSNLQRIQVLNNLEVKGIKENMEIILPDGILPAEERPGYVAPRLARSSYTNTTRTAYTTFSSTGSGGRVEITRMPGMAYVYNSYAAGNCTWYSYERRLQLGRPIGRMWGNASSWAYSAAKNGFTVNKTPAPGAIFQTSSGWYGYGHVGIVEQVLSNGDIVVTEMNYAGYNVITRSIIKAQFVGSYNYIH